MLNSLLKVNIIGLNKSEPLKIVILQILKTKKAALIIRVVTFCFLLVSHEAT